MFKKLKFSFAVALVAMVMCSLPAYASDDSEESSESFVHNFEFTTNNDSASADDSALETEESSQPENLSVANSVAASNYDTLLIDPDFVGSHIAWGEDVEIPFLMTSYGQQRETFYVRVYSDNNKLCWKETGPTPKNAGEYLFISTWSYDDYKRYGPGLYWVNFYTSGDQQHYYDLFAFYIDAPTDSWVNSGYGSWFQYADGTYSFEKFAQILSKWLEMD